MIGPRRLISVLVACSLVAVGAVIGAVADRGVLLADRDTPNNSSAENAIENVYISKSGAGVVLMSLSSDADGISILDDEGELMQVTHLPEEQVSTAFPLIRQQPVTFHTRENGSISIPVPAGERAELARTGTLPESAEGCPLAPGKYQVIAVDGNDVVGRQTLNISETNSLSLDQVAGDCTE